MKRKSLYIFTFITVLAISINCGDRKQNIKNEVEDKATLELKINSSLGEGAFWNYKTGELYWIDIEGKKLFVYDPETKKNRKFDLHSRPGTVVPSARKDTAVIAMEDGIYLIDTKTGKTSLLSDPEKDIKINRFNDGKCDPNGNLWVGSMNLKQDQASAFLYKIEPDGRSTAMLDSITISNGIVWTKDKSIMYYIDTPTGKIMAYDYDQASATISNKRVAVVVPESVGYPDGMCIDENDMLWVGLWNGNAVGNFDPATGKLIRKIEVPAHNVTSCAFGGKNLDILYITTAGTDMTPEEQKQYPYAGSVFKFTPGIKGIMNNFFEN